MYHVYNLTLRCDSLLNAVIDYCCNGGGIGSVVMLFGCSTHSTTIIPSSRWIVLWFGLCLCVLHACKVRRESLIISLFRLFCPRSFEFFRSSSSPSSFHFFPRERRKISWHTQFFSYSKIGFFFFLPEEEEEQKLRFAAFVFCLLGLLAIHFFEQWKLAFATASSLAHWSGRPNGIPCDFYLLQAAYAECIIK